MKFFKNKIEFPRNEIDFHDISHPVVSLNEMNLSIARAHEMVCTPWRIHLTI